MGIRRGGRVLYPFPFSLHGVRVRGSSPILIPPLLGMLILLLVFKEIIFMNELV